MKINEVRISGLFGTFSHSIPLTHGGRVTIIHGPNGFGKTVMLQMIAALISGQTEIFERIPFEEFQAIFDDGSIAIIRHCNEATVTEGKLSSKLEIIIIDKHGIRPFAVASRRPRRSADHILQRFPARGQFSRSEHWGF